MLPIIDFSDFTRAGAARRKDLAEEIARACEDVGFFYLKGHGITDDVMASAQAAGRRFFALPDDEKAAVSRSTGQYRGYIATSSFSENRADGRAYYYEAFIFGAEVGSDDREIEVSRGLFRPNLWPCNPKGFRPALCCYWDQVTDLVHHLLRAFALALGQDEAYFLPLFQKPLSNMSLLHYPPPAETGGADDARPHFDTDVVTVLLPDPVGGLEVKARDGTWIKADPPPGCFVVNIGNMLELWSGGRFRSTLHRVHPPRGRHRFSIAYFAHPNYATIVSPLPGLSHRLPPGRDLELHAGKSLAAFVATFDPDR